jgi:hypothetical protein
MNPQENFGKLNLKSCILSVSGRVRNCSLISQKEQENFFLCRKMKGHGGNKFIVKIRGKMVVLLALQVQQLPCGYSKCT